jgi:hypothetical protein
MEIHVSSCSESRKHAGSRRKSMGMGLSELGLM